MLKRAHAGTRMAVELHVSCTWIKIRGWWRAQRELELAAEVCGGSALERLPVATSAIACVWCNVIWGDFRRLGHVPSWAQYQALSWAVRRLRTYFTGPWLSVFKSMLG